MYTCMDVSNTGGRVSTTRAQMGEAMVSDIAVDNEQAGHGSTKPRPPSEPSCKKKKKKVPFRIQ